MHIAWKLIRSGSFLTHTHVKTHHIQLFVFGDIEQKQAFNPWKFDVQSKQLQTIYGLKNKANCEMVYFCYRTRMIANSSKHDGFFFHHIKNAFNDSESKKKNEITHLPLLTIDYLSHPLHVWSDSILFLPLWYNKSFNRSGKKVVYFFRFVTTVSENFSEFFLSFDRLYWS